MLNSKRVEKVRALMREKDLKQVLICDPVSIFYLSGQMYYPGERFLGLLINHNEYHLFLNELFPSSEENKVYFSDSDNLNEVLKPYLLLDEKLGVDKNMMARFLLPLQEIVTCVNGSYVVDEARAVKDEDEIKKMKEASLVNDKAMAIFKTLIKEGVSEKEVADKLLAIYQDLGASDFSFEPIVAFGKNAADPHHIPDDTILKEGDAIIFDVGCVLNGYCSDMTRTFFYKSVSEKGREIYNLVRKANEEAERMLKEGIRLCDIDKKARDIIAEGGYGKDFTHRLGHFIGIDVHEFGDVSSANPNFTKVGNIFSIEPGIYNQESGIGVRIEDLVLIEKDGASILNNYSHELEIIE